jgi:hypothetical protein
MKIKIFFDINVNLRSIGSTLKRNKKSGQEQPKKKTGRIHNMRTKEVAKKVRERFRRTDDRSVRKMIKEFDASRIFTSNDLKLKP